MRIAILGATSQIAKDLVLSFHKDGSHDLVLYARRPENVLTWLKSVGLQNMYRVAEFTSFGAAEHFDAIINFVGSGDPAQIAAMGTSILDATLQYDTMVLDYLRHHTQCRYLFLSSGAAYGTCFDDPVDENSKALVAINNLRPQDWYAIAKVCAECRHRSLPNLPIVDIRVFNYFSHTQDLAARFFITDILRSIRAAETLITSPDNIIRDYIGPGDFYQLVARILSAVPCNDVVDCYTQAPVDKMTLLSAMKELFGLTYKVNDTAGINATGVKMNYFSRNRRAEKFGYSPTKTSLSGVLEESRLALAKT